MEDFLEISLLDVSSAAARSYQLREKAGSRFLYYHFLLSRDQHQRKQLFANVSTGLLRPSSRHKPNLKSGLICALKKKKMKMKAGVNRPVEMFIFFDVDLWITENDIAECQQIA